MKKLIGLVIILLIVIGVWWIFFKDKSGDDGLKQEPLKVGKHSDEFNKSLDALVTEYLSLKETFVTADCIFILGKYCEWKQK